MILGKVALAGEGATVTDRMTASWSVDIKRGADEVFDYLADFSRHGEWSPKPFRTEDLPSGSASPGLTFVSYGAIPGDKEHRNEVNVTEVQRPTRLVFSSTEPNGEVFVNTFTVTSRDGGSHVEREWDFPKPSGVMGVMFPVFMRAYVRPQVQKGLDKLKQVLESA
jgi:uncharacterized protein YndB with AHSA1/START domain